ncbi:MULTISPECIES: hypothetical protein [unclassified Virgibacillus]|uniref:hypothetical protein n=1 Tax=unclassified Virgibacillus TaxID=2620237 RepID=UPI0024DE5007|nr:hypothetical protein [Virgibacillus sp. LDC-1]
MKRTDFLGAVFLISGVFLYGIIHLAIANYVPSIGGWSEPPGKFKQVRDDIMVNIPYFLSIAFILIGLVLLFLKEIKNLIARLD